MAQNDQFVVICKYTFIVFLLFSSKYIGILQIPTLGNALVSLHDEIPTSGNAPTSLDDVIPTSGNILLDLESVIPTSGNVTTSLGDEIPTSGNVTEKMSGMILQVVLSLRSCEVFV